jgi:hypothetical protein
LIYLGVRPHFQTHSNCVFAGFVEAVGTDRMARRIEGIRLYIYMFLTKASILAPRVFVVWEHDLKGLQLLQRNQQQVDDRS